MTEEHLKIQDAPLGESFNKFMSEARLITYQTRKFCIEVASRLPNKCMKELLDNADKVAEYCKEYLT